jgi:hypothetical protein
MEANARRLDMGATLVHPLVSAAQGAGVRQGAHSAANETTKRAAHRPRIQPSFRPAIMARSCAS